MMPSSPAPPDPDAVHPGSYLGITNGEWDLTDRELERATAVFERLADRYSLHARGEVKHPSRSLEKKRGFWGFELGLSLDPETIGEPEHRYELVEARGWDVFGYFRRGYERRTVAEYGVDDLRSEEPLLSTAESVVAAWPIRNRGS
jgi:hypothetical protein